MSETTSSTAPTVRLIGGPPDWDGQVLTHVTEAELAGPRAALGGYLVSSCVPAGHPDPGARAAYEPGNEPLSPGLWFFQGWVPYWSQASDERRGEHHELVGVESDADYLPVAWVDDDGARHQIDRILVHRPATGEDDLAPDAWHVRSGERDWELLYEFPDHWRAAPLPAIEDQEHDGLG
ncbi:hypothetical protein [Nocardiopsis ganjiahuensis]|uniref:hypothetical protein n=1 Tax=Nocardiopsis ganjiahuensis TaxID=239984 RepID=UPI0003480727|nr:hypothetical protein [Nocardiopsis ganjiahuensis]